LSRKSTSNLLRSPSTPLLLTEQNCMCRLFSALLIALSLATAEGAERKPAPELSPEKIPLAEQDLKMALVGPGEEAFLQILIKVSIVQDPAIDTSFVYDLIVRFDPDRYRNPRVGLYPLNFEDQFILWGKRIAIYTRSTSWQSGRFYLHDISSSRPAWIYTEDARRLYIPSQKKLPSTNRKNPATFSQWLKIIAAIEPGTDLRTMNRWLRLIHHESRTAVLKQSGR
jgi:hypothetical protein